MKTDNMEINDVLQLFEDHLNFKIVLDEYQIDELVAKIPTDFVFNLPNNIYNLPLYRARLNNGTFDTSSLNQFGYIRNCSVIDLFRFNKKAEQVLYTSTHPITTLEEIDFSSNSNVRPIISKWKNTRKLKYMININPHKCSSHAGNIIWAFVRDSFAQKEIDLFARIGTILEWPVEESSKKNHVYKLTSSLASKLFETYDVIVTTSTRSETGELNITFNKNAADTLELSELYEYEHANLEHILARVFQVGEVTSHNSIEWHSYAIDYSSIRIINTLSLPQNDNWTNPPKSRPFKKCKLISEIRKNNPNLICALSPNIQCDKTDFQTGIIVDSLNGYKYYVSFKYSLK